MFQKHWWKWYNRNLLLINTEKSNVMIIASKLVAIELWRFCNWLIQCTLNQNNCTTIGTKWRPLVWPQCVNSSPPSYAYMRRWTGPSLIQVMACRLFGAKPLSEPMLAYCQLDSWEQISVKFKSKFYLFIQKIYLKMSSAKLMAILSRGEMS